MIRRGRTAIRRSLGRGLEERKLLLDVGVEDEDEKIFL